MHSGSTLREHDAPINTRPKKRRRVEAHTNNDFDLGFMPIELLCHIFSFADLETLLIAGLVSKGFYEASRSDYLWKDQLQARVAFAVNPSKLRQENETYQHLFFKCIGKCEEHTFVVSRHWNNQLDYNPVAYFNENPVLAMENCRTQGRFYNTFVKALCGSRSLRPSSVDARLGLGGKFILEFDLPMKQVQYLMNQEKYEDLLHHLIKIHPNWELKNHNIQGLLVKYEDGQLLEVGTLRPACTQK